MSNRPTFKEAKMQTKKEKRAHTAQIQILDVTRDRDGEARAEQGTHRGVRGRPRLSSPREIAISNKQGHQGSFVSLKETNFTRIILECVFIPI